MKQKDFQRLMRLSRILNAIPLPQAGGGTQSATMSGFVSFSRDWRALGRTFGQALIAIARDDDWQGFTDADADTLLIAMEQWVEARSKEQWSSNTTVDLNDLVTAARRAGREAKKTQVEPARPTPELRAEAERLGWKVWAYSLMRRTNDHDPVPDIDVPTGKTAWVLRAPSGVPFLNGEPLTPDVPYSSRLPNPDTEIPLVMAFASSVRFTVRFRHSEADAWADLPRTPDALRRQSWR